MIYSVYLSQHEIDVHKDGDYYVHTTSNIVMAPVFGRSAPNPEPSSSSLVKIKKSTIRLNRPQCADPVRGQGPRQEYTFYYRNIVWAPPKSDQG